MSRTLRQDVAIIGGGLVGSSAALALRRMGFSVVLLDKGFCGAQASGVNYGGVRRQGRPPEQIAAVAARPRHLAAPEGAYRHRRRIRALGPSQARANRGRDGIARSLCGPRRGSGARPRADRPTTSCASVFPGSRETSRARRSAPVTDMPIRALSLRPSLMRRGTPARMFSSTPRVSCREGARRLPSVGRLEDRDQGALRDQQRRRLGRSLRGSIRRASAAPCASTRA